MNKIINFFSKLILKQKLKLFQKKKIKFKKLFVIRENRRELSIKSSSYPTITAFVWLSWATNMRSGVNHLVESNVNICTEPTDQLSLLCTHNENHNSINSSVTKAHTYGSVITCHIDCE